MKASISLVIVMGITWIMGVLVFTDDLLPVAYIFTIFVAFQGLIIFIVLVIFSKQVSIVSECRDVIVDYVIMM
jgi:hypothetical protein